MRCLSENHRCTSSTNLIAHLFETDALESLSKSYKGSYADLLRWWYTCLTPEYRNRTRFAFDIAMKRGAVGLTTDPSVVIGTIHSVKGGESDVVYLFPDLSKAADAEYTQTGPPRDAIIRVAYVGITRARETLYLCSGEGPHALSFHHGGRLA